MGDYAFVCSRENAVHQKRKTLQWESVVGGEVCIGNLKSISRILRRLKLHKLLQMYMVAKYFCGMEGSCRCKIGNG